MNKLLVKKMIVAFLAGFFGVFLPVVLDLLDKLSNGIDPNFGRAVLISLVAAAFSAGVRAIIALLPINLVPTDKLNTLFKRTPQAVTVDKSGDVVAAHDTGVPNVKASSG